MSFILKEAVRQGLLANSDLVALIGANLWSQYAPGNVAPDGPWLVMLKLDGGQESAHDGDQHFARARFQFIIGGTDPLKVEQVRAVLLDKFNGVEVMVYTGQAEQRTIVFLYDSDGDGWNEATLTYNPAVTLLVMAET